MRNNKPLVVVVVIVAALVGLPRLGINPMSLMTLAGLTTRDGLMVAIGAGLMWMLSRQVRRG